MKKGKIFLWIFVILLIGGLATGTWYFYDQYQKIKKNPELISKNEVEAITTAIGRFMNLPKDEQPTIATITDQEKLKTQPFFKNSKNGDKVLIYTKVGKAILYRPSTNRIIEFAPLAIGGDVTNAKTTEQANTKLIPITIYNGSNKVGLTNQIEEKLKSLTGIEIIAKESAQKKDYEKTLIVDISGSNKDLATKIADLLGGQVSSIPKDETTPKDGILVIAAE